MDMAAICCALGNKMRYQLIMALKNESISTCCDRLLLTEYAVSVGDVVKMTGLAQSTVSQHLSVLVKAVLLRREKRELWSCYFLNTEVLIEFLEQMNLDLQPQNRA